MNNNFREEIFNEIKDKLMDENFISKYGTSVSVNMGREYQKYLEENYIRLKNEFDKINKNSEDGITKAELREFLQSRRRDDHSNFGDKDINALFSLIDINKDSEITIKEFVVSYMILEEKIRIRKFKYQKEIEDLKEAKDNYMKLAKENKDEKMNLFGVAENAELKVTLIEGDNVGTNSYVILTLDQDKQNSSLKKNTSAPIWNEEFIFNPASKDRLLLVEVYDKSDLGYDINKGQVSLPLRDLESQTKYDDWHTLVNKEGKTTDGKIYLRIHFLWSKFTYYQNLINRIEKKLTSLNEQMNELNKYFDLFKTPFGLILYADIEELLEKKLLQKSDDNFAQSRRSVFLNAGHSPRNNTGRFSVFTNESLMKGMGYTKNFNWTLMIRVLMGTFIFTTLASLLERSDFLNLMTVTGIWTLYFLYKNENLTNKDYLKHFVKWLIVISVYDIIWMFCHEEGVFRSDYDYQTGTLQKVSFIFTVFGLGIKIAMIVLFYFDLYDKK